MGLVDEDDVGEPSLFEQLLDEAAGPWVTSVRGHAIVVDVPAADDVCELDEVDHPEDVLELLAGEDTADELLDLLEDRPSSKLLRQVERLRRHFAVLTPPPGGFTVVVEEIDRYGAAIEADLHTAFGLDLHDWIRDHDRWPWAKLLRLLERMPEAGHYDTARRADDDLARQVADARRAGLLPTPTARPPLLGWTHDRELLTGLLETNRQILHGIWGASPKFRGKGGRPPKGLRRPEFAADRIAAADLLAEHDEFGAALLGDRYRRRGAATAAGAGERQPPPEAVRGGVLLSP